jgi:hypothetical protein
MMCFPARVLASFSQAALSAALQHDMPAPFWGGVKDLKMLVGEPCQTDGAGVDEGIVLQRL